MRAPVFLFSALLAALLTGSAVAQDAVREVRRTFAVKPGVTLVLDTYRGDIAIEESEADEIRVAIDADFDVETEAEAERLWRGFDCRFEVGGNSISITARNEIETGPRLTWRENSRMKLYYRISVPRQTHLQLQSGAGNITVGRLEGRMLARVDAGTIFFRQVEGSIQAIVGEGDIVISRCSGAVMVRASRGSVRIGTIGGASDLKATNGSIEVLLAKGALTAFAEAGDVTVNFPRDLTEASNLATSGGHLAVTIDPAANCEVDASATWGRVRNTLPLAGGDRGKSGRRLTGTLNAGGPRLTLQAKGGSVTIGPGQTPFE